MKFEVVRKKKLVNVPDLYSDQCFRGKEFRRSMDALTGWYTLSVMMAPVLNSRGDVLGLIEVCNKESEGVGYQARARIFYCILYTWEAGGSSASARVKLVAKLTLSPFFWICFVSQAFSKDDEKLLTLLCSHAGRFIEAVE